MLPDKTGNIPTFMEAYNHNRKDAVEAVLQSTPVASILWELSGTWDEGSWTGTATQLLDSLNYKTTTKVQDAQGWPKSPRHWINASASISGGCENLAQPELACKHNRHAVQLATGESCSQ